MKTKKEVLEEFNSYIGKELDQYDIGAIMEGFENNLSLDIIISEGYDGDQNHILIYKDHQDSKNIYLIFENTADSKKFLLKAY